MSVYLVQNDPKRDYRPAAAYGAVVGFVFSHGVFPDNADERVVEMKNIARNKFREFDPEVDYLLLNGDTVSIMMATNVLAEMYGSFKTLKWDNQLHEYYEVRYPHNV